MSEEPNSNEELERYLSDPFNTIIYQDLQAIGFDSKVLLVRNRLR